MRKQILPLCAIISALSIMQVHAQTYAYAPYDGKNTPLTRGDVAKRVAGLNTNGSISAPYMSGSDWLGKEIIYIFLL